MFEGQTALLLVLAADAAATPGVSPVMEILSILEKFGPAGVIVACLTIIAKWLAIRLDQMKDRHFAYMDKTADIAMETKEAVARMAAEQAENNRLTRGVKLHLKKLAEKTDKVAEAVHQEGRATVESVNQSSKSFVAEIISKVEQSKISPQK